MAEATLNDVSEKLSSQMRVDETISRGIHGLRDDFQKLYGIQTKLLRELAEAKREGGATGGPAAGPGSATKDDGKGLNPFLAAAIVAITAMVTAVTDYFQNVTKLLKTLFRPATAAIRFLFGQISQAFRSIFRASKIGDMVADIGQGIRGLLTRIGSALRVLIPDPEAAQDAFKVLQGYFAKSRQFFTAGGDDFIKFLTENSIFKVLKTGFLGIRDLLFGSFEADEIKLVKDFLGNIGSRVAAFFEPIKNFFSFGEGSAFGKLVAGLKNAFGFAQEGSAFMKTLGTLGRVIGRLVFPITLVMSVVDAVTGAFKGYMNEDGSVPEKLLMGLLGGISGLLEGLVGMPLNLLKSAVSFIAGKLGFEGAEKFLDSFNFTDIIRDIVMSPLVMLKRVFNGILETIATAVEAFDIPFVDEKAAAQSIRNLKFEDTGESRTEMVARKKNEEAEAQKAMDDYDASQGFGKKKYTTRKAAANAARREGGVVVQDNTGAYRVKTGVPRIAEDKSAIGDKFMGKTPPAQDLTPVSGSGAAPVVTVVEGDTNVGGSGTLLAGEARASTGNDRAVQTGFLSGVADDAAA